MSGQHQGFSINRRRVLQAALAGGSSVVAERSMAAKTASTAAKIHYALNTSTVRGQKLSVPEQVDLAGKASYDGIEPWISDLRQYEQAGGRLGDLRKRIADQGLKVPSAIGFAEWLVNYDGRRAGGMETRKAGTELGGAICG